MRVLSHEEDEYMKKIIGILLFLSIALLPLAADNGDFDLDLDLGIDYQLIDGVTMIGVNLQPDISIGKIGIGIKAALFFEVGTGDTGPLTLYTGNWIPDFSEDDTLIDKARTAAGLYFPLFRYVRYGYKGDPLYARIGQLDSTSVGTGMFVTSYTNTLFQPNLPLVGAVLDVDGRLFDFPYVGFEGMTGNLAEFDLIAGRLYSRPFAFLDVPVVRDMQLGLSYASDRNPALYSENTSFTPETVSMYGIDFIIPVIDASLARLRLYTDYGFQPDPEVPDTMATGWRAGMDGHILGFLTYRVNLVLPTDGYKPDYFNASYDFKRESRYNEDGLDSENFFLNGSGGFDLLDSNLVFDIGLSSEVTNSSGTYLVVDPVMTAKMSLGEDLLGFVFFDAMYRKQFDDEELEVADFLDNVFTLKNSEVRANVSFKYNIFIIDSGYVITFDNTGAMNTNVTVGGTVKLL